MNYKNILIATDFSESSLRAVEFAINLTQENKLQKINILHVCDFINKNTPLFYNKDKIANGKSYKELIEDNLHEQMNNFMLKLPRNIDMKQIIEFGDPKIVIPEVAQKENCDLIILAKHGHNFLTNLFIGSTTEKVLKTSPIDILVFQGKNSALPKKICAYIDFSPLGNSLFEKSKALALSLKAPIELNHLIELNTQAYMGINELDHTSSSELIRKLLKEEHALAQSKLNEMAVELTKNKIMHTIVLEHAKDYRVAEYLINKKNNVQETIHVLAAHNKSKSERFFFGSVTQRFIEQSEQNVLVIKS